VGIGVSGLPGTGAGTSTTPGLAGSMTTPGAGQNAVPGIQ
jgi:hypothetical protein